MYHEHEAAWNTLPFKLTVTYFHRLVKNYW